MPAVVQVALVHDGRVLVVDGDLPEVVLDEDADDRFTAVLDRVGADTYLAPIVRREEDRYLDVVGCRATPVPLGRWAAPSALGDHELADLLARTLREREQPPALRPAWFRAGWYDEVEAWVDASLERVGRRRTGVMRPTRMWSISGVLRVPTESGDVWFKAACELFRAEAALHRVLGAHFPDDVPVLVDADDARGWLLMEPLPGCTDETRAPGAGAALVPRWAEVQLASLDLLGELRAAGALVRDADAILAGFRRVLTQSREVSLLTADELDSLRGLQDEIGGMVRELWQCGLPDTLSHGDLHLGNVAYDGTQLRVFDLTDCCISHPLLDAWHLAHFDDERPGDDGVLAAFAGRWRDACPDARIDRAVQLVGVADLVFQVDTFDRIAAGTEPASAYELGGAVAWLLRRLPGAVAAAR